MVGSFSSSVGAERHSLQLHFLRPVACAYDIEDSGGEFDFYILGCGEYRLDHLPGQIVDGNIGIGGEVADDDRVPGRVYRHRVSLRLVDSRRSAGTLEVESAPGRIGFVVVVGVAGYGQEAPVYRYSVEAVDPADGRVE